jgi:hypothetical protein
MKYRIIILLLVGIGCNNIHYTNKYSDLQKTAQRTINRITVACKQKNKNMNTIEGNKLITEFMGAKYDGRKYMIFPDGRHIVHGDEYDSDLKYHSSWDWLMPVVEKIEALGYDVIIEATQCTIWKRDDAPICIETDSKIKATCQAVQQFIQWLNKEQSVKESDTSKAT